MSVLWICYPRFRLLYAAAIAAVSIGLVGANFHFLGDVIAGAFLGISVGWLTVTIWEIGRRGLRGASDYGVTSKTWKDPAGGTERDFHQIVTGLPPAAPLPPKEKVRTKRAKALDTH
jgi:hypothetical protein